MEKDLEWFTAAISGDILAWELVPSPGDQVCSGDVATHTSVEQL